LQERGQIHYHIITPTFIHYQQIRDKWNYLQMKGGFLDDYKERFHSTNPNSTDVHSMKNIRDVEAYLCKYMLKNPDQRSKAAREQQEGKITFDGKVYDCSLILKVEPYYTSEGDSEFGDALRAKEERGEILRVEIDFATILYYKFGVPFHDLPVDSRFEFEQWRRNLWSEAVSAA